jgi:hypothetical protein
MTELSHFFFGDFSTHYFNSTRIDAIKSHASKKNIYFWFDEEIDFYDSIHLMLKEHSKTGISFCITSKLQPTNSADLLEPFDKYEQTELFPNGDDRTVFEAKCKENLDLLYDVLKVFCRLLEPEKLRIFVTVGYDVEFMTKRCTLETMMADILDQVCNTIGVDSTIFEIVQE